MRTCKFYSPSQYVVTRWTTAKMAPDYEFNAPFNHAACSCPDVKGTAPYAVCNFEGEFGGCSFYVHEEFRALKSVIVDRKDEKVALLRSEKLSLLTRRTGYGIPEYQVVLEALVDSEAGTYGNPIVLHTVDPSVHGMSTKLIADTLFSKELEEERSSYPYENYVDPAETVSYIETVVSV